MVDGAWNAERFGTDVTSMLESAFSNMLDAATLARAVSDCAATAEVICCDRPMACTAGCPHCCVLNVAILLPEGMIIADWLREQLPPSILDILRERLADHYRRVRWMDDDERIAKQVVCPLLDAAEQCSIYSVRPLVCRAVASFNLTSCREAFNPVITNEEREVSADLLRQAVFDEVFISLARAIRHHGLDDRSIELGSGVLAFLELPEYRDRLLSGERLPDELWQ